MNGEALRKAAGRLVIGGFSGEQLPAEFADRLRRGRLGGAILFARNIENAEQVSDLTTSIHALCPQSDPPLIVSVDQEGGPVARLRGIMTDLPPMKMLGRLADPELCTDIAEMVGAELAALGFNTNFAPVMDVSSNPQNPIIGERAFSDEPQEVARLALCFAAGLLARNVIPCAKHFPGHGDTDVDSHLDLPFVRHAMQRLTEVELVPFAAAIGARLPLIMTAHIVVEALDSEHPATLSRAILTGLLRSTMGFQGVIVSDDLEMAAVADRYDVSEIVLRGLDAGLDLFLFCHSADRQEVALETLVREGEANPRAASRIFESARRVERLRTECLANSPQSKSNWGSVLRSENHLALARRISGNHTTEG